MKRKMRKCVVCGVEYDYCNNCIEYKNYPVWMTIYHDENCKEIMHIATEYSANNLTKEEASILLNKCNLANRKNFKESVANAINDILGTKKAVKTEKDISKKED